MIILNEIDYLWILIIIILLVLRGYQRLKLGEKIILFSYKNKYNEDNSASLYANGITRSGSLFSREFSMIFFNQIKSYSVKNNTLTIYSKNEDFFREYQSFKEKIFFNNREDDLSNIDYYHFQINDKSTMNKIEFHLNILLRIISFYHSVYAIECNSSITKVFNK